VKNVKNVITRVKHVLTMIVAQHAHQIECLMEHTVHAYNSTMSIHLTLIVLLVTIPVHNVAIIPFVLCVMPQNIDS
jgi:hypothetical protein